MFCLALWHLCETWGQSCCSSAGRCSLALNVFRVERNGQRFMCPVQVWLVGWDHSLSHLFRWGFCIQHLPAEQEKTLGKVLEQLGMLRLGVCKSLVSRVISCDGKWCKGEVSNPLSLLLTVVRMKLLLQLFTFFFFRGGDEVCKTFLRAYWQKSSFLFRHIKCKGFWWWFWPSPLIIFN